jgi:Asp-tRNA(Asn)/Glu-tRNA(Gln) amidotransferase A subunit family amidase
MALAWSMDKLGPLCRSAEDCALVLNAIYGPDGHDMAVRDIPFTWDATLKPSALRVGYAKALFDAPERGGDPANPDRITHRLKQHDDEALETLKRIGTTLIPVEVPTGGVSSGLILLPEAGAAFEELVRSGHIKEMVQQTANAWPNTFRAASFVPAIAYINANRARTLMMQKWWDLFRNIDVLVIPTGAGGEIQQTNLTGNPSVIIPHGFRESQPLGGGGGGAPVAARPDSAPPAQQAPRPNTPVSLTFLGPLYQEEKPLALAHAFQKATDFHLKRPPGFTG